MLHFRAHGEASLRAEGQVVVAEIVGPWNLELIHDYQRRINELVEVVQQHGPWSLIIVLRIAAMCPPDAVKAIREGAIRQSGQEGRVSTAYVIAPDVEGYRFMDSVWRGIYADVHPFGIFETQEEAMAWSEEQLRANKPKA